MINADMNLVKNFYIATITSAFISSAYSATDTDTFTVQATVASVCTITANDLIFSGTYDPTSNTNLDDTSSVDVTCTTGTDYTISLSAGLGTGATVAVRTMTLGTDTLDYTIYQDAGRTVVWGETIGVDTVAGTGNGTTQNIIMYGRVFSNQPTVPPGTYTDTVTATVTY